MPVAVIIDQKGEEEMGENNVALYYYTHKVPKSGFDYDMCTARRVPAQCWKNVFSCHTHFMIKKKIFYLKKMDKKKKK